MNKLWHAFAGFALLEIVMAVALISTGLLAGLHVLNHNVALSHELTHRIYAHTISANLMRAMDALKLPVDHFQTAVDALPSAPRCWSQSCSQQQLAKFFVSRWKCHFSEWYTNAACLSPGSSALPWGQRLLPQGAGQILVQNNQVSLRLYWHQGTPAQQLLNLPYVPLHPVP